MPVCARLAALVGLSALAAGCHGAPAPPPARVAASNSYLESVARDLLGQGEAVISLAGAGMCPGHFDIRPGQVAELRRCRVLLRLDFQKALDAKLAGARDDGLRIAEIRMPGGLCEPASYLAACRQAADTLVQAGLLDRPAADRRLAQIADRVEGKAALLQQKVAGLKNMPVLASTHQEAFCGWLGLNVVGAFSGADTAGVGQVDLAVRKGEQAGAKLVIANLPEGRRVADALAERLGAKVVVFGNFPAAGQGRSSFDDLLEGNVERLLEAAGQ